MTPTQHTARMLGEAVPFSATFLDAEGDAISGGAFTWTSQDTEVAPIDATSGIATALAPGATTIRARAEGLVGTATLMVDPEPGELVKAGGDDQTGPVGLPLSVAPKVKVLDVGGTPVPGFPVEVAVVEGGGSTSSPATTGADGVATLEWVLGREGPQRLRARAGSLEVEFSATAEAADVVIVTQSLPNGHLEWSYEVALEAVSAAGGGFDWTVVAGDLPEGLSLSSDGRIGGVPTRTGAYLFTARAEDPQGGSGSRSFELRICDGLVTLDPGETAVRPVTAPDPCGWLLPAPGGEERYRVAVVRTRAMKPSGPDRSDVETVTLRVTPFAPMSSAPDPWSNVAPKSPRLGPLQPRATLRGSERPDVRAAERALFRSLKPGAAAVPPAFGGLQQAAPAAPAPARITYDPPRDLSTCQDHTDRPATLLDETAGLAVYQDSVQRLERPASAEALDLVLDYYSEYGKDVVDAYTGGGLPDPDGDQRLTVLIVPEVSQTLAAVVWSGDFLARSVCPASNERDVIYLSVDVLNAIESPQPNYQMAGTLVHESWHVYSLYNRVRYNARTGDPEPFHPTWMEEGMAEIVAEMSSRAAWAAAGGPAMTAPVTLADLDASGITPANTHVALKLQRTAWYLSDQPNAVTVTPSGGSVQPLAIYGAGWHFHRWLGDRLYPAPLGDAVLLAALADSSGAPGPSAYQEILGEAFPTLLERYAAAIMLNGTGAAEPGSTFRSYDFPSATLLWPEASAAPGSYPWPVTVDSQGDPSAPFAESVFAGPAGETGIRVHDLRADGSVPGGEIHADVAGPASVVIVRLR